MYAKLTPAVLETRPYLPPLGYFNPFLFDLSFAVLLVLLLVVPRG